MHLHHRLSLENIAEASRRIDPVFLHTPQYVSEGLSALFDCTLTLKIETLNPAGSFKGRGASYFTQKLETAARLVCASAGNFGQALAYCCRAKGIPLTVFAAVNANPLKVAKMREFGAEVLLEGEDFDEAKLAAAKWAQEHDAYLVVDGLQKEIAEGAGSLGVELLAAGTTYDVVVLPLGNGALLTGVARWVKAHSPGTRIIGVSSLHARAMHDSWKSGRIVTAADARTIADGIAVRIPIPEAVEDMQGLVDDVVLVSEESLQMAMQHLLLRERLLIEPAGAAAVAALLGYPELCRGLRAAIPACGGNLTTEQIRDIIQSL